MDFRESSKTFHLKTNRKYPQFKDKMGTTEQAQPIRRPPRKLPIVKQQEVKQLAEPRVLSL